MTPEERRQWLDAVEGKPYIPQGKSEDHKPEHTLTLVGVSLCFLFWLYKCWEFVTSAGPNDGWFGLAFVTVFLLLGVWHWVWEMRATLKSKEKELAKQEEEKKELEEELRRADEALAKAKEEEAQQKNEKLEGLRKEWKRADEMQEEAGLHHRVIEEEQEYYRGKYGIDIDSMEYDLDFGPRNDDPDHYDYEPDMDDGEYNPYEDDYGSD